MTRASSNHNTVLLGATVFDINHNLSPNTNTTRSCHARRHNDLKGHSNFSSTIYSFSILCLEHHYCGDQQWCSLTQKLNPSSAFVYFRWSWSCYFVLRLGLVSSSLRLGILVLVLVLRIWSCLHHWFLHKTANTQTNTQSENITSLVELITGMRFVLCQTLLLSHNQHCQILVTSA